MLEARLAGIREQMARLGLDALLVTDMANVFYLSGFTGSTAALIVTLPETHILVDPRYSIQARTECESALVLDYSGKSTIAAAGELVCELKPRSVGYEAANLTVSAYRELRKRIDRSVKLRSTRGTVEKPRAVKDAHEIALIRRACEITDAAFDAVVCEIRLGMTEKDVALLIDCAMRKLGADKEAFDTIVACGPNSACPHAKPTDALLERGQLMKMDFGARYAKYNADITRTVCPGESTPKQREVYRIVLDAQMKAIEAIAPGKTGREIDSVARDYITSQGYGENFGHGLGHSLGISCHDGPGFSQTSEVVMEPGMVMTVEPGVYVEGWGGVRIEDDVLVTDAGVEVLTKAPRRIEVTSYE